MSEKKENTCDGYVCIYECGKHFWRSTYERSYTVTDISTCQTEELIEKYKGNYEDIQYCIVVAKESERSASYPELNTLI